MRRKRKKRLVERLAVDGLEEVEGISRELVLRGVGAQLCLLVVLGESENPDYVTRRS